VLCLALTPGIANHLSGFYHITYFIARTATLVAVCCGTACSQLYGGVPQSCLSLLQLWLLLFLVLLVLLLLLHRECTEAAGHRPYDQQQQQQQQQQAAAAGSSSR
jgi:membrane protein implicated in regulation of membrane protease activity